MRLVRASWLLVLAVIIVAVGVPALRHQFRLSVPGLLPIQQTVEDSCSATTAALKPYQERAPAFVGKKYPNDSDMLMAAGVLTDDADFLKRAAETGNTPAAWATYVEFLMKDGPPFERVGRSGVNPADAAAVAQEEKRVAESGLPDRLTPEEAGPVLSALRSWQEADPENALPVALETRILYGLHRDSDALSTCAQAGRMPLVTSHTIDRAKAVERLLVAMGMPRPEAIVNSNLSLIFPSFALLRDTARIALYEGRLAAMRGDPVTAITWWQGAADFALHMQGSDDTIIGFLVGAAIEGIGASPVWQWVHDGRSGIPSGPLLGGRYFWGDQHALYVTHMGDANDQALLDSLILGKLRTQATRDYGGGSGIFEGYFTAARYLSFVATALTLGLLLFVIFLAVGAWSRRAADEATNLRPVWQLVLAALILAPLVAAAIIILRLPVSETHTAAAANTALATASIGIVLLILIIPLLAALGSRAPGARFRTAWRGNLRRILPVSIALSALLFLGLSIYASHLRGQWEARLSTPGANEMSDMIRTLGDKWTNPTIPPDAYRAQYPPNASP